MLEALRRERFPTAQPGRCDGMDSDRTDGCCVRRCSYIFANAGLCGPVVYKYTGYNTYSCYGDMCAHGVYVGTNLGNDCPTASPTSAPTTVSPTSAPTVTTISPTSAPTVTTVAPTTTAPTTTPLPCCERLRLNPVFCAMEKINRPMMAARCQVCGPPPWSS